jgi:hypothetical protein
MPEVTFVSGAEWGDLAALAELYTGTFQEILHSPSWLDREDAAHPGLGLVR